MSEKINVSFRCRAAMWFRLFAVQGSWNYETLLGTGIGFCIEPALRELPDGLRSPRYRAALARHSRYFNAHPYFAGVAVGALARAELDDVDPERIERFRTALASPLGSVGDRLVWASWLPLCSLLALAVYGLGAGPLAVIATFLILYNAGHFALRFWALNLGLDRGLAVASGLGNPMFRQGPAVIGRIAAVVAGIALPLVLHRVIGPGRGLFVGVVGAAVAGGFLIGLMKERADGWRIALGVLAVFALYAVVI
ncbi:MAG: PTS system mannose/fructose/sorbose family transporter subunit IID [Gemmatimonadaceae bacterium]|nr:PTS system mannose/fructose/sorbose family transporter subunit IID [Gemmatimonadaceae bacterium]